MFAAYLILKMIKWSFQLMLLAMIVCIAMCVYPFVWVAALLDRKGGQRMLRETNRSFHRALHHIL